MANIIRVISGKIERTTYILLRELFQGQSSNDLAVTISATNMYGGSNSTPIACNNARVESSSGSHTQTFSFTNAQNIIGFRWGSGSSDRYLNSYTISYSDDNSTYTTAKTQSGINSPGSLLTFTFDSVGKHKYWRVVCNSPYGARIQWWFFDFIAKVTDE